LPHFLFTSHKKYVFGSDTTSFVLRLNLFPKGWFFATLFLKVYSIMAGSTALTDSTFYTAIDDWFQECTFNPATNTLTEGTGTVFTTYGLIRDWNTTAVTSMSDAFSTGENQSYSATTRERIPYFNENISLWNTGAVTDMRDMFYLASAFNQPLNSWNTAAVTNMSSMFVGVSAFNQPLNSWNTGAVTDMNNMFASASAFNQDISSWNTGAVTDMRGMFFIASAFNQPLNNWNTGAVTDMGSMFLGASAFNQPLNSWNAGAVTDMSFMFSGASAFNQDISSWNTGAVTDMSAMFGGASAFNQPLNSWNTGAVTDMSGMFGGASAFNQDISSWNTGAVTNMRGMFSDASAFNQPLNSWNTGAVTNMRGMFSEAAAFNQPLNNWNTGVVTDMRVMFYRASAFSQDISSWNLSLRPLIEQMFIESAVPTTANNNVIYTAWKTKYGYTDAQLKAAGLTTPTPTPISNICFPVGTLIQTDQGEIAIEQLQKGKHTIGRQMIKHITQTISTDKYLIRVGKDVFGKNKPTKPTVMSKDHKIEFHGDLVSAYRFLDYSEDVKKVKYSGEILYNVLLEEYGTMSVNNLRCETLDPTSPIGCLYQGVAYKERKIENTRFKI
jgi:surface protein